MGDLAIHLSCLPSNTLVKVPRLLLGGNINDDSNHLVVETVSLEKLLEIGTG